MKEKQREIKITQREKKVIKYIAKGYTDKEIALSLNLTYFVIRNIFNNLLIKTGTVNRAHLVSFAYREGIL